MNKLVTRLKFVESCLRYETGDGKVELLREKDYLLKAIQRVKHEGRE
jgi:hypothetical protein